MTTRRHTALPFCIVFCGLSLFATGCATRYQFDVDAYASEHAVAKQRSFRLVDAHTAGARGGVPIPLAMAHVASALELRGRIASPAGTVPDVQVHVDLGMIGPIRSLRTCREPNLVPLRVALAPSAIQTDGASGPSVISPSVPYRQDGSVTIAYRVTTYRKYLQLTAFACEADGRPRPVWSVHVSCDDASSDLAGYVRRMAMTAVELAGGGDLNRRVIAVVDQDGHVRTVSSPR